MPTPREGTIRVNPGSVSSKQFPSPEPEYETTTDCIIFTPIEAPASDAHIVEAALTEGDGKYYFSLGTTPAVGLIAFNSFVNYSPNSIIIFNKGTADEENINRQSLPAGFLITEATVKIQLFHPPSSPPSGVGWTFKVKQSGQIIGANILTAEAATNITCPIGQTTLISRIIPIDVGDIFNNRILLDTFGWDLNYLGGNVPQPSINALYIEGNYVLWSTSFQLSQPTIFTGQINDDEGEKIDEIEKIILIDGVGNKFPATILQQNITSLTFQILTSLTGILSVAVFLDFAPTTQIIIGTVTIPNYSGIYAGGSAFSSPGRDQFYDRSTTPPTTIGVKIPNPTIRTGFISDEDE